MQNLIMKFIGNTGFSLVSCGNLVMILIGIVFIYLGIAKHYEPLLLIPIGFGILMGNIPVFTGFALSVYEEGSILNYLYFGIKTGIYPSLIFMGIGAMTDFSPLLAKPSLMLLGAAAQFGIFATFLIALLLGFPPNEAASIGIIGGADGPTAIFLSSKLAPNLISPIAIAGYSYIALIPVIQPPIMKLLTTKEERRIKMTDFKQVSKVEKIIFPITAFLLCCFIAPTALPLLGMLFLGNLLKEAVVTERLAESVRSSLTNIVTVLIGITIGSSTQADVFLTKTSMKIFVLGVFAFAFATASGIIFAKIMNLFLKNKINPLLGAAGVSAVPDAARVVHVVAQEEDSNNFLLMHAMVPNVAGVIGSALAAGILWSFLM